MLDPGFGSDHIPFQDVCLFIDVPTGRSAEQNPNIVSARCKNCPNKIFPFCNHSLTSGVLLVMLQLGVIRAGNPGVGDNACLLQHKSPRLPVQTLSPSCLPGGRLYRKHNPTQVPELNAGH